MNSFSFKRIETMSLQSKEVCHNSGVAMNQPNLFDITSPEVFFDSILRVRTRYASKKTKHIEDLLYMIFGLNHLREWIAPGYDYKKEGESTKPEHIFFKQIWELKEFQTIRSICNHSKHLCKPKYGTTITNFSGLLADWDDLQSVTTLAEGTPVSYFVDGNNILQQIDPVIDFYKSKWF